MNASHRRTVRKVAILATACALAALLMALTAGAATTIYTYDALGRLTSVTRSDGNQTIYELDPAGNRTEVREGVPPGAPGSVSIPAANTTSSYTISWTAPSSGTVTAYELYASNSSNFAAQSLAHRGSETSKTIAATSNTTLYYRVRACNGSVCSGYRTGANAIVVRVPPGTPASIDVPGNWNIAGSYTVRWGAASGTISAYELYEAMDAGFANTTRVYSGTALSFVATGRANGTYYYRVRACNGNACSNYIAGTLSVTVVLAPGLPSSLSVPSSSDSGNYSLSWGTASGNVTSYELQEASTADFVSAMNIYVGTATSFAVTGRGNGTFYYRVRGCNQFNCSAQYRSGANGTVVTLAPGAPGSITVPSTNSSGTYTISWGAASGAVSAYQLWEATNPSFSGEIVVYNGPGTSFTVANKPNGTYYYRVRPCNGSTCGNYTAGANGVVVTIAPGIPRVPTGLSTRSIADCAWGASWDPSPGATNYQFRTYADSASRPLTTSSIQYNCPQGQTHNYRPKSVEACNGSGCSAPAVFGP